MATKLQSRLKRRTTPDATATPETNQTLGDATETLSGAEGTNAPTTPVDKTSLIAELRQRMKRIEARTQPPATSPESPPRNTDTAEAPPRTPSVDTALPGEVIDTAMGEVWCHQPHFDAGHHHGDVPIHTFLTTGHGLATLCRDARIADLSPEGALFIDTETTGLSGGTGTLPFLIGVAWFTASRTFVVEQIFCRDPSEEPAQLERLRHHMARATHLVSFNGRAFDLPLINTRCILNRAPNPGVKLPHVDLLHVARRIFSRRLANRSLNNLEDVILGFRRQGDIPGAQIPAVYAHYLRTGEAADMVRVFEHNALDLIALAALGGVLENMYNDPEAVAHAADNLGLAQSAFHAGHSARGFAHLHRAEVADDADERQVAWHLLARQARRSGDADTAHQVWQNLVARYPDDAAAHLALAKDFEHRLKDYAQAIVHARSAQEAEGEEASERRLARLGKKDMREKNET